MRRALGLVALGMVATLSTVRSWLSQPLSHPTNRRQAVDSVSKTIGDTGTTPVTISPPPRPPLTSSEDAVIAPGVASALKRWTPVAVSSIILAATALWLHDRGTRTADYAYDGGAVVVRSTVEHTRPAIARIIEQGRITYAVSLLADNADGQAALRTATDEGVAYIVVGFYGDAQFDTTTGRSARGRWEFWAIDSYEDFTCSQDGVQYLGGFLGGLIDVDCDKPVQFARLACQFVDDAPVVLTLPNEQSGAAPERSDAPARVDCGGISSNDPNPAFPNERLALEFTDLIYAPSSTASTGSDRWRTVASPIFVPEDIVSGETQIPGPDGQPLTVVSANYCDSDCPPNSDLVCNEVLLRDDEDLTRPGADDASICRPRHVSAATFETKVATFDLDPERSPVDVVVESAGMRQRSNLQLFAAAFAIGIVGSVLASVLLKARSS